MNDDLVRRIDALLAANPVHALRFRRLPPVCAAIAEGRADIDRCPPAARPAFRLLAALLGRATKPLSPEVGEPMPPRVAVIDEDACIGCTKCIQACPVDAIVGASKHMHTVIASWCTGCELCIPPCPVDCIVMADSAALPHADLSRERHELRAARLAREAAERDIALAALE
jgi:electron transport complex protein RnfB